MLSRPDQGLLHGIMFKDVATAMALSMAVASISILLTKAKITRWVREWIESKEGWIAGYFKGLFRCPYCMSHPWAFAVSVIYTLRIVKTEYLWLDIAVSTMIMICPSMFFAWVIYSCTKGMEKANDQTKWVDFRSGV